MTVMQGLKLENNHGVFRHPDQSRSINIVHDWIRNENKQLSFLDVTIINTANNPCNFKIFRKTSANVQIKPNSEISHHISQWEYSKVFFREHKKYAQRHNSTVKFLKWHFYRELTQQRYTVQHSCSVLKKHQQNKKQRSEQHQEHKKQNYHGCEFLALNFEKKSTRKI